MSHQPVPFGVINGFEFCWDEKALQSDSQRTQTTERASVETSRNSNSFLPEPDTQQSRHLPSTYESLTRSEPGQKTDDDDDPPTSRLSDIPSLQPLLSSHTNPSPEALRDQIKNLMHVVQSYIIPVLLQRFPHLQSELEGKNLNFQSPIPDLHSRIKTETMGTAEAVAGVRKIGEWPRV
ncbi:hypothetical protein SISNIDRAFT_491474 [Sistotremastrum niveocremeum HHB9708]|uniref:Uncharacterized protein n=1 Tax=Sistotremastrum niveocremeum HHB9708 TaxID=1314777 RepID=A0A164MRM6_9AGAM|nr:hypothetical protein SISNIDRAFT_491474 [Sistotremastrum niveocremeum HHB9708]